MIRDQNKEHWRTEIRYHKYQNFDKNAVLIGHRKLVKSTVNLFIAKFNIIINFLSLSLSLSLFLSSL